MAGFTIGEQILHEVLLEKEKVVPEESAEIRETKARLVREAGALFQEVFSPDSGEGLKATVAPGRVNLIGEHIDYCDGFVLPMNIPLYTVVLGRRRVGEGKVFRVHSSHAKETVEIEDLAPDSATSKKYPFWTSYIRGALYFSDCPVGLDFVVHSSIPAGAGLSSSAALELAVYNFARQFVNGPPISQVDAALACQRAEHHYALVPCGIMDQFVISLGLPGHALRIDCRSLEYEHIPIAIGHDAVFLVTNSGVKHQLAGGEYKKRKQNVDSAVQLLGVPSWRDVNHEMIRSKSASFNSLEQIDNAYHVVDEIERTLKASNALLDNNIIQFGKLMTESHISLRDKYKVSCAEQDQLVDLALEFNGVFGARMTGGGFGGCTVTLVRRDLVESLKEHLTANYTGGKPTFYVCEPVGGVSNQATL